MNHIKDSADRQILSRVLDLAEKAMVSKKIVYSDFLSPLHVSMAEDIIRGMPGLSVSSSGGYLEAERKILSIYPDFKNEPQTYPIQIYRVAVKSGNPSLSHRDYLGSIMGLGIVREKLGDIVVIDEMSAAVIVQEEMADFLCMNLTKIARANASLKQIDTVDSSWIDYQENVCTVTSLRLDLIVAQGFHIPRNKAEKLIRGESVKVDWKTVNKPGCQVNAGSMISCRGYGRVAFMEQIGKSKKGKNQVKLRRYR